MTDSPNRLQYGNSLFVREEANGTTALEVETNTYRFFENEPFSTFESLPSTEDAHRLFRELDADGRANDKVELSRPFRVNWLASLACNLVCVYCYAEDKMDQKRATEPEVFEAIDELSPMVVGITGGEPLMSPYLTEAIERFSGNYGLILDTNGTVKPRPQLLEALKESNTTVRVTVDATDKSTLNLLRPSRSSHEYEPDKIFNTIQLLGEAGINTAVHSVMTSQNADDLATIGDKLVDRGITTWQLYPVEYTHKYRASYPFLRVTDQQINDTRDALTEQFQDTIDVRVYDQRELTDGFSVVMIENDGKIVMDGIGEGIRTIQPGERTLPRVMEVINARQHIYDYLY